MLKILLPKKQMSKLKIYKGETHPHESQNPKVIDFAKMNSKNYINIEGITKTFGSVKAVNNIDLDIPSIPACLKLHDIDVIVRIRTLKNKKN